MYVIDDANANDWRQSIHWPQVVSIFLLIAGIGLIVRSIFIDEISIGRAAWSQQQASDFQETAIRLHGLSHEAVHAAGSADEPAVKAERKKAQAEYDALLAKLEDARKRPLRVAWFMRIGGGILLVVGVAVFLASDELPFRR